MVNLTHCTSQTLRAMLVVVDGEKSRVLPLISGVSQGSALGPLLFLVFINEVRSHQIVLYHSLLMTSPCINASSYLSTTGSSNLILILGTSHAGD